MKARKPFGLLLFLFICTPVAGQFTINKVTPSSNTTFEFADSINKNTRVVNDYFSKAKWVAERRALRKERNNIEFNSGLDLSQTQFENWASGGDNTFAARATLYYRHQFQREKLGVDYKVEARYGISRIDKANFKNEDEFSVNFLTTWSMVGNWSYAASANLRSQFATGYVSRTDKTRKSTFMAPGYLDLAIGCTYNKEPWNIVLSPVGGSAVFVLDKELSDKGFYGLDAGQRTKWKVGPSVRINFDKTFYKDIFRFRSELYSFTNTKTPPLVRWENTFTIKATKFLSTTLYFLGYYDKESETPKPDQVQLKYSISLGLAYTFKNK